ncbi:MAG: hypothetical protein GQ527_06515 [Bacteroidales bacterium]|nr:hypothetical protein [Bacteroidales bacterium]
MKPLYLYILIILLTFSLSNSLVGQNNRAVNFQVSDFSNGENISFARILDRTHNRQYLTDDAGFFKRNFPDSTLIKVSAIGYHDFYILLNETTDTIKVEMSHQIYQLKEFVLSPYLNEEKFKEAFINFDLEENNVLANNLWPIELMGPKKFIRTEFETEEMLNISFSSPISGLYNAFSRRAKSTRKYHHLKGQDNLQKRVEKKYNLEIIRLYTGIKDDKELKNIMEFCQPSISFILSASDYEIALYTIDCYQRYQVGGR